jgi:hypothetical protein
VYCKYYQAKVNIPYTWFVTGVLRSEEHLIFERTLAGSSNQVIEFFVPQESEEKFLQIMQYFLEYDYVFDLIEKENRLKV